MARAAETAPLRNETDRAQGTCAAERQDLPDCYLAYSHPSDVARVEHLTFICTSSKEDAGPNNNWMPPAEARARMDALYKGCMKGRTLYVVPYCMGPIDSPYARLRRGNHRQRLRGAEHGHHDPHGPQALERIAAEGGKFVRGLHSIGELDPERVSSCTSRSRWRSRASGPATAATRCWARNAMRCASPATRPAPKAGWPSTCSSWA